MKALQKVLEKLNALYVIDGETFESEFSFKVRENEDLIFIYDENENYTIDYLEEKNALMQEASFEFGFSFKPIEVDEIYEKIDKAIKKDFGKDTVLDWYDHVTLCVRSDI